MVAIHFIIQILLAATTAISAPAHAYDDTISALAARKPDQNSYPIRGRSVGGTVLVERNPGVSGASLTPDWMKYEKSMIRAARFRRALYILVGCEDVTGKEGQTYLKLYGFLTDSEKHAMEAVGLVLPDEPDVKDLVRREIEVLECVIENHKGGIDNRRHRQWVEDLRFLKFWIQLPQQHQAQSYTNPFTGLPTTSQDQLPQHTQQFLTPGRYYYDEVWGLPVGWTPPHNLLEFAPPTKCSEVVAFADSEFNGVE